MEVEKLICGRAPALPSNAQHKGSTQLLNRGNATDLDRIVLKAMHKVPDRRYSTAADLSADIERYLNGFPVVARPDSVGYRAHKFISRHRWSVAAAALFLLTVVGLSVTLAIQANRAREEAASANAVSEFLVNLFQSARPDATQGNAVSARDLLNHGKSDLQSKWQGDTLVKARLLTTLGSIYQQMGEDDQATQLLTESEDIYRARSNASGLPMAEAANWLGNTLLDKGDIAGAARQYNLALNIFEKKLSPNSTQTADVLGGIASVEVQYGHFDQAISYDKHAMAIHTRVLGAEAQETLLDKHNLQVIYTDQGDYASSERLIREVLAVHRRTVGENQIVTAGDLNDLIYILDKTGRFGEEEPLIQHLLATRVKLLGPQHPDVALTLLLLGWLEREQGRLKDALGHTEQALVMFQRFQGEQAPFTLYTQDALGLVYLDMGQPERARPLLEKVLRARASQSTPSSLYLVQSYDHLGLVELAERHLQTAKQDIQRSLNILAKAFPKDVDSTAISFNHRGQVELALGEPNAAAESFRHALRIARASFGDEPHPITAEALYGLGEVALLVGDPSARASLEQSLAMRRAILPAGHYDIERSLTALARAQQIANMR